jgi:hypothetical protein
LSTFLSAAKEASRFTTRELGKRARIKKRLEDEGTREPVDVTQPIAIPGETAIPETGIRPTVTTPSRLDEMIKSLEDRRLADEKRQAEEEAANLKLQREAEAKEQSDRLLQELDDLTQHTAGRFSEGDIERLSGVEDGSIEGFAPEGRFEGTEFADADLDEIAEEDIEAEDVEIIFNEETGRFEAVKKKRDEEEEEVEET